MGNSISVAQDERDEAKYWDLIQTVELAQLRAARGRQDIEAGLGQASSMSLGFSAPACDTPRLGNLRPSPMSALSVPIGSRNCRECIGMICAETLILRSVFSTVIDRLYDSSLPSLALTSDTVQTRQKPTGVVSGPSNVQEAPDSHPLRPQTCAMTAPTSTPTQPPHLPSRRVSLSLAAITTPMRPAVVESDPSTNPYSTVCSDRLSRPSHQKFPGPGSSQTGAANSSDLNTTRCDRDAGSHFLHLLTTFA